MVLRHLFKGLPPYRLLRGCSEAFVLGRREAFVLGRREAFVFVALDVPVDLHGAANFFRNVVRTLMWALFWVPLLLVHLFCDSKDK